MRPIYRPKGAALEYADLALNIYTGCTNGCDYCYAPGVLRKTRDAFSREAQARQGLIEALEKQLAGGAYRGKTVHLCFTCDPYPANTDTMATNKVISLLKAAGCHVQILTKNPDLSVRDWHMLDEHDWIGTTYSGDDRREGEALGQATRLVYLEIAKKTGFNTWVSCEPVLDPGRVLQLIRTGDYIDLFKIGKLNHEKSCTDWAAFGREAELACEMCGRDYVIKDALRKEMQGGDA